MGCPMPQCEARGADEEAGGVCEASNASRTALACMINAEASAVLAVMRRNVRWGGHYKTSDGHADHALILSFKGLRKQVFALAHHPWHVVSPAVYLQPFLDVIRSDEAGAPITGVALSSVHKILTHVIDQQPVNVEDAMHLVVDAVTGCRFEVTDPASEEVVLMKILQVLLACMKCKAAIMLTNQHVCTIVNTCFRIVHQAGSKGELLQRIARHTMHELVRCIFSHLPVVSISEFALVNNRLASPPGHEAREVDEQMENGKYKWGFDREEQQQEQQQQEQRCWMSFGSMGLVESVMEKGKYGIEIMAEPYGVPCMVEIFHFLCSLLSVVERMGIGPRSNATAFDEDVPLFALGLINSAIELSGPAIRGHAGLLGLIQDGLFRDLVQFGGLSTSPLVLSMVCSIVLNLYHHLRAELKLQMEAFFSRVILRLAQSRHGASLQQREVAMEALVDFCRQRGFMAEMYANLDCDITCSNVFEDLATLLSRSAFPVNCPLSEMHVLALDGLIAVVEGMAERIGKESVMPEPEQEPAPVHLAEYAPFWTVGCDDYGDPRCWVPFVRQRKYIKRRLMIGADHFNRDPKKGLEFLQGTRLLPEKLDPRSVACFFRYTAGLDKNLVGDFLGNHDEFCVRVLHEFAGTFDFQGMNLDTALRLFLEAFRLPGESQKIQRVLEAFSERYYEQSAHILANKDAALLLSYSLIMLNTDLHNAQVKKKMTEEDFVRNTRHINGGGDLPREFLSQLYHSICDSEIRTTTPADQAAGLSEAITQSHWIDLMHRSRNTTPYVILGSGPHLDRDMFTVMSGPAIAAMSVVFDHAEEEDDDVCQTCVDGFLAVARISACHHLEDVLDDLVVSLCKFTTLLSPSPAEEPVLAFGDDAKARMATVTVFHIANRYGDYVRAAWRNILNCIIQLHRLGLLPARVTGDSPPEGSPEHHHPPPQTTRRPVANSFSVRMQAAGTPRRSSGLMGRFSQLLSLDAEEPRSHPTEQQLAAHQRTVQTIQDCHVDSIFTESKFLHSESLMQLARALVWAAGRPPHKGSGSSPPEDEDTAVFCLELLIAIALNNRDRIALLWDGVYEHIASIVQSTLMPCALVEKAIFGLLRICQRLLPYKETVADELLKSLQLVLRLDARVADAYCEQITQEVGRLVRTNAAHIKSPLGWRTITSLLSITARHPEASEPGFDSLLFIMVDGAHMCPANYTLCVDTARQFAESRVGQAERSVHALDLMAGSVHLLASWSIKANQSKEKEESSRDDDDEDAKLSHEIKEMWLRLVQGLGKICSDQREEVRNHTLLSLQKCITVADGIGGMGDVWLQCFDLVIFQILDDLLEIAQGHSSKDYRNMEGTLIIAAGLLSKLFLQMLGCLANTPNFCRLWLGVLDRMEQCMKVKFRGKKGEKLHEIVPELLKNIVLVMKARGILTPSSAGYDRDNHLWQQTWLHINNISPSLQSDVFQEPDGKKRPQAEAKASPVLLSAEPNSAALPPKFVVAEASFRS